MHNVIIGVFLGWLLFSINGTAAFWKAYHVIDRMGDAIVEGAMKDIDIKKPEPKEEIVVDTKREAYLDQCQRYGFTITQCQQFWDQDGQTALTIPEKPNKIKQHKPTEQPI